MKICLRNIHGQVDLFHQTRLVSDVVSLHKHLKPDSINSISKQQFVQPHLHRLNVAGLHFEEGSQREQNVSLLQIEDLSSHLL